MAQNVIEIVIKADDQSAPALAKTRVNIEAIGKTLTKVGAGLTASVTAPLLLIVSDAIKASESYAELEKAQEAFKAELGKAVEPLVPVLIDLTGAVTGLLVSFNSLPEGTKNTVLSLIGLAAAAGPVLMVAGQILVAISGLGPAFAALSSAAAAAGPVLAGIAAVLTGPVALAIIGLGLQIAVLAVGWDQNWFWIQDTVNLATENIKSGIKIFTAILKGDWEGAGNELKTAWQRTWDEIKRRLDTIFPGIVTKVKNLGKDMMNGLKNAILNGVSGVVSAMISVATAAINAAKLVLGIQSPSTVFAGIGNQIMAGMAQGIRGGVGQPMGALAYATPQLLGAAGGLVVNMGGQNINSNLDIEYLAQRVARVIKSNRR